MTSFGVIDDYRLEHLQIIISKDESLHLIEIVCWMVVYFSEWRGHVLAARVPSNATLREGTGGRADPTQLYPPAPTRDTHQGMKRADQHHCYCLPPAPTL
jgi:hypothetical protein